MQTFKEDTPQRNKIPLRLDIDLQEGKPVDFFVFSLRAPPPRADIEEHIRDEHSTFTWLLEPMIERSGFRIENAVYSPDGIFAQYIARAV